MGRRERLEARLMKREEWAGKAHARAEARFNAVHRLADGIPLGQPILVGHHSERRARRDVERIHSGMNKGCEEADLARRHESKASGLEAQIDRSVYSDDADAVEQLEARISERERTAAAHAAINKAWRTTTGTATERAAKLVAMGVCSAPLAQTIATTMALCPYLKAPLDTTNLRASIRRDRERIEEVRRRTTRTAEAEASGGVKVLVTGEWCVITFAEKPAYSIIAALKASGFRWGGGSWTGRRDMLPAAVKEMEG